MTSNDDLELRLESWLTETARPIPTAVLESVVEALPRHRQVGRPLGTPARRLDRARWLLAAASLIVAVGTVVMTAGPNGLSDWLIGPAAAPSSEPRSWNAANDFRSAPGQRNPSPDQAGNPGVWSYLSMRGGVEDASAADLLPIFDEGGNFWTTDNQEIIVGRADGALWVYPSILSGDDPRSAVVRWRSPVSATVRVSGLVGLWSRGCTTAGAGVTLTIVRNGAPLEVHALDPLIPRPFSRGLTVASSIGLTADVEPGDAIDFVVSPRTAPDCLDTKLYLTITTQ